MKYTFKASLGKSCQISQKSGEVTILLNNINGLTRIARCNVKKARKSTKKPKDLRFFEIKLYEFRSLKSAFTREVRDLVVIEEFRKAQKNQRICAFGKKSSIITRNELLHFHGNKLK